MPRIPRLLSVVTANVVPIAVAIGGAFLLRRLIGAVLSVLSMFAVGRLLLTALKVDLALAEHRVRDTPPAGAASPAFGGKPPRVQQPDQQQPQHPAGQLRGEEPRH